MSRAEEKEEGEEDDEGLVTVGKDTNVLRLVSKAKKVFSIRLRTGRKDHGKRGTSSTWKGRGLSAHRESCAQRLLEALTVFNGATFVTAAPSCCTRV